MYSSIISSNETKSLKTQYQIKNNTQIRKNQKDNKIDNDELEVQIYPKKKKPVIEKPKVNLPSCPSCEERN